MVQIVNDLTFTKKIDFLKSIGSDEADHSGRTLLDHLIGTSEKLREMGANFEVAIYHDHNNGFIFSGDSNTEITKGLLSLLINLSLALPKIFFANFKNIFFIFNI